MPVYVIADIKVMDATWVPSYASSVHDIVHRHGGRYLARSGNITTLEFPSKEAVGAFASDPQYAPFAAACRSGSESRLQLIDNTDVAGTIEYLPKA
jgi:uncharacterized protein (DUF1330 family)